MRGKTMITFSKSIHSFSIFTSIVLSLCLLYLFSAQQRTSRACFFIGNGAYYALSAQDSYDNPPAYDSHKTSKEFVENFSPDSVFSDFTRALFEKEQNIFVTHKTWNSFVHLINRIQNVFKDFGITKPLEQIFIDDKTQLPSTVQKTVQKNLIAPQCNPNDCYNIDTIPLYHPLLFYGPTEEQLADSSIQNRFDEFKKQCGLLHPYFSQLLHFLVLFNPSDWRMYDTKTGLYYLTPRTSYASGINVTTFTQLDTHAAYKSAPEITCTIHEDNWAFYMDQLFTPTHNTWQVYLTGHGSEPIFNKNETFEEQQNSKGQKMTAWIGGIPGVKFKPFLEFLDTHLKTEKLFLSSCHVPAKRLLKLVGRPVSYNIITPIATYDTVLCYVPFGYITYFKPAWLNANGNGNGNGKMEIAYTLKPSESDACTPLNIPKYSSLLASDIEAQELRKNIDMFVKAKAFEAPTVIEAGSVKVEKLVV